MSIISQREAHRLRKRVRELEERIRESRQNWRTDFPDGRHIGSIDMTNLQNMLGRVEGVRFCGSAVVATVCDKWLRLYAVKQPEVQR